MKILKIQTRGILFDMDGVLVSSLGSVERSWHRWAIEYGVDPELAICTAHGCRALDTVRFLRPDIDAQAGLQRIEDLEVEDNEGLEILPGVPELLAKLPAGSWTVVTSATERLARVRMQHGGIPVPERFITADLVANGKPHPEPYLKGAELLGLAPADCLVIEDAASGTKAGHAAGCKVLATLFSHSIESLAAADWIVESLKDVSLHFDNGLIELEFTPVDREAAVAR
ncbi:MAG: HAD-IA family hydrolase [Acidobacteriaceae bacterium]